MPANSFAAIYQSFTNAQLYEVLQNKEDYQPAAVEAAATELKSRNLSATEMEALAKDGEQLHQLKQERQEKKKSLEKKVKGYLDNILKDLDPLAPATIDRNIRMICIGIALIMLYSFIKEYRMLAFILKGFSAEDIPFFLPYIAVPTALVLFWNKKKGGWIILTVWLIFTVFTLIFSFVQELQTPSGNGLLELVFPKPKTDIAFYIISLLVYGGLLVYLNTRPIKRALKVSKDLQVYLILACVLLMLASAFYI